MRCGLILTVGLLAAISLSACASSSVPSNFLYETSLRGEQGFPGRAARGKAAERLLAAGVVTDPAAALEVAFPNKKVKVRRWGFRYFNADWTRYQVVLDADIGTGRQRETCREQSHETPVGAPMLRELQAAGGARLQSELGALVQTCVSEIKAGAGAGASAP